MREHVVPCPHHHSLIPISRASPDVFSDRLGHGRVTQRLSPHSVLGHGHGFCHTSQDHISPRVRWSACMSLDCFADRLSIYRFPDQDEIPDFTTFSSLLRITAKYELPGVRSRLLKVVRDAYPEDFEGLIPSKRLGESIFSGRTPHPNEVLNLFVQQEITSALPMAYYMAVRRGLHSLINPHHSASARLPQEILEVAMGGLMALREMELKEIHVLIFDSKASSSCPSPHCTSPKISGPGMSDVERKIVDQITGSSQSGTKILQVLSWNAVCGCDFPWFCERCVKWWESGHARMRKKAWAALSSVFGMKV